MFTSGPYTVIASATTEHQSDIILTLRHGRSQLRPALHTCRRLDIFFKDDKALEYLLYIMIGFIVLLWLPLGYLGRDEYLYQ